MEASNAQWGPAESFRKIEVSNIHQLDGRGP